MTGDRGEIVLGWLVKLVLGLSVVGVVGFDAVSLTSAQFQVADAASGAARAAATSYASTKDVQKAYDAAYALVVPAGDAVGTDDFAVAPDGAVTLTVTRTAPTLLLEKVGPLRRFTHARASGTGRPAA